MNVIATPARLSTASSQFDADFKARLHWSAETDAGIEQRVADILWDVQHRGDAAVLEYTARFDGLQAASMAELELTQTELKRAFDALPVVQRDALQAAASGMASAVTAVVQVIGAAQAIGAPIRTGSRATTSSVAGTAEVAATPSMASIPAAAMPVAAIAVPGALVARAAAPASRAAVAAEVRLAAAVAAGPPASLGVVAAVHSAVVVAVAGRAAAVAAVVVADGAKENRT